MGAAFQISTLGLFSPGWWRGMQSKPPDREKDGRPQSMLLPPLVRVKRLCQESDQGGWHPHVLGRAAFQGPGDKEEDNSLVQRRFLIFLLGYSLILIFQLLAHICELRSHLTYLLLTVLLLSFSTMVFQVRRTSRKVLVHSLNFQMNTNKNIAQFHEVPLFLFFAFLILLYIYQQQSSPSLILPSLFSFLSPVQV